MKEEETFPMLFSSFYPWVLSRLFQNSRQVEALSNTVWDLANSSLGQFLGRLKLYQSVAFFLTHGLLS